MKLFNWGNSAGVVVVLLSGLVTACSDDDDPGTTKSDAGTGGTGGAAGAAGADAGQEVGTVSGVAQYSGSETGFLEIALFPSTEAETFGEATIAGLAFVDTPVWPEQAFTIEDVAPGTFYIYMKINVGPSHVGPGPDDPTSHGAYMGGGNWEYPPPQLTVVAGQDTVLSAPVVLHDPTPPVVDGGSDAGADAASDAAAD